MQWSRRASVVCLALASFAPPAAAQRISFGIVGGTNLTPHFPVTDYGGPADDFGNPAYRFQHLSGSRSLIIGGSLESRLTDHLSIEGGILHRPLTTDIVYTTFPEDGPSEMARDSFVQVRTWEFPLLLKYNLGTAGRLQPFVAAGPAFRTQEDASAAEPSQLGIAAGVGFSIPIGPLRLTPTIRYTRWRREHIAPRYDTKPDQVEFLAGLSYDTGASSRRILGRQLEIGGLVGLPLTKAYEHRENATAIRERTRFLAGFAVETAFTDALSMEVNAIYNPLRGFSEPVVGNGNPFVVLTWQFPILVKYRLRREGWNPFVEAGPSFRLTGNLNGYDPSHLGISVGAGIEKRIDGFRFRPAVRYTRWARDEERIQTNSNALELVFGVSF